jgi:pimeloyl-ACP methyl ester carboxylesterase
MRTVTLSGWGQAHDALSVLEPHALHIDYAHAANAGEAMKMIAHLAHDAERVIGWSLGGQLAVRAIAGGFIKPKQLVLIATPYQFVQTHHDDTGMKRDEYDKFHDNYMKDPERTLTKSWKLISHEDMRKDYIELHLDELDRDEVLKKDWLRWLRLLEGYSCNVLDFEHMPPTLVVHGKQDVVVDSVQARIFANRLGEAARVSLWENCGHAPHWHDSNRLKKLIVEHANV